MTTFTLRLDLKSDAVFGRGDGLAGLLDMEVQHDTWGCPFLAGRTLKGLLAEECANLLCALEQMGKLQPWLDAADALFGVPGSTAQTQGSLVVSNACWPVGLRTAVHAAVESGAVTRDEVLAAAGVVRRQTALSTTTGAPLHETLRSARALVREVQTFEAELTVMPDHGAEAADAHQLALLAACAKALRRAGSGRNRGRGEIDAALLDPGDGTAAAAWNQFEQEVEA